MVVTSRYDTKYDFWDVQVVNDDHSVVKKLLKHADYIRTLMGTEAKSEMISIGQLPRGYYDGRMSATEQKDYECIIVVPQGVRPVELYEETFMVPFPITVFKLGARNGKLCVSYVYAASDEVVTDQSRLSYFPFSNVYEDGKICWGQNTLPNINAMRDFDLVTGLFFGSPANTDLYYPSQHLSKDAPIETNTLKEFLGYLDGKDEFPAEILKECGKKISSLKF